MKVKDLIGSIADKNYDHNAELSIGFYDYDNVWHEARNIVVNKIENKSTIHDVVVFKQNKIKIELVIPLENKVNKIKKDIQNILEKY